MRLLRRTGVSSIAAVAVLSCVTFAQTNRVIETFTTRRPLRPEREIPANLPARPVYDPLRFRVIELPPPDAQLIREARENSSADRFRRTNVGIQRAVSLGIGDGQWEKGQGTWRWRLAIKSDSALAMRLHFSHIGLPEGTLLYAYSPDPTQPAELITALPDTTAWSQIIPGDTVLLELKVISVATSPPDVSVQVSEVGHMFERLGGFGTPSNCEVDASCYPNWSGVSDAVALIYGSGQYTFVCSGALLNNLANDYSSMFLTAKHCFSDSYTAHSAVVYWKYKTSTCNGTAPDTSVVPQTKGAELLSMSDAADATLLYLTGTVPADIPFDGWTTAEPAMATNIAVLHHPVASFRRFAQGARSGDLPSYPNDYAIYWSTGIVEPGSSGAPGFNTSQQIIGYVTRGSSQCGFSTGPDLLGKFLVAYPDLNRTGDADLLTNGMHDDAYAPNFTQDTAATLPVPFPTTKLAIVGVDKPDWFRLPLPPNTKVTITAASASDSNIAGVNASLYPNGDYAGFVNPPYVYRSNSSGTTLVFAVGSNGGAYTTYNLSVDVTSPTQPAISGTSAVDVLPYSLTLLTTIAPSGLPTTYAAEYSTDANFSTYTTTASGTVFPAYGVLSSYSYENSNVGIFISVQPQTTYYARVVATNDQGTVRSAPVSFTTPAANLNANFHPNQISFPLTDVGTPALALGAALYNTGNVFFKPDSVTITPPFTVGYDPGQTCSFYSACVFTVGFIPPYEGTFSGTLTVTVQDKVFSVPLSGSGTNQPELQMMMLDWFPSVIWAGTSASMHAQLTNVGVNPLAISGIAVNAPFSAGTNCPASIAHGVTCILTINFTPTTAGSFSSPLVIANNGRSPNYTFTPFGQARDINLSLARGSRPARPSLALGAINTNPYPSTAAFSVRRDPPVLPIVLAVPHVQRCTEEDAEGSESCRSK